MTCKVTTRQEAGQHQFKQLVLGVGTGTRLAAEEQPRSLMQRQFWGQSSTGKQLFPV